MITTTGRILATIFSTVGILAGESLGCLDKLL
jgi:hypothetical protein